MCAGCGQSVNICDSLATLEGFPVDAESTSRCCSGSVAVIVLQRALLPNLQTVNLPEAACTLSAIKQQPTKKDPVLPKLN